MTHYLLGRSRICCTFWQGAVTFTLVSSPFMDVRNVEYVGTESYCDVAFRLSLEKTVCQISELLT